MELQKVIFSFGRNDIYDYYILEEKKDAIVKDIEKDTLAFKIGGPGKIYISHFGNINYGNYDYLLEKRKKGENDYCGHTLATEDEITRI